MSEQQNMDDGRDIATSPQPVPVNMYETTGALVIVAPLAGVMPADVEVRLEGSRLAISAVMRTEAVKDYTLHEWHYGPYERTLDLPKGFGANVTARFGNGQLAVSVERGDPPQEPIIVSPEGGSGPSG